jgi:dTDP-4-amino-4,6-dideoxygalactose transaminase
MNKCDPAENKRVYLSAPDVGETERRLLNEAFDSNWIAPLGPFVEQFEKNLSAHMKGRPVVSLSSGTAAIHLALIRLGVTHGDAVIVQSFTFCATANPIAYLGAEPIFVGSEGETWNMCPESLEVAIKALMAKGRRPKAIIPVHLYGVPAKMDAILAVARRYEIAVIEDAAESLGSTFEARPTGTFGAFGVLSFNGNKIITTSGGGALVCADMNEYYAVKHLATQARDPAPYYLHSDIGYNYRLSNLCAAVGVAQLESLPAKVARRRTIRERYREELSDVMMFAKPCAKSFENHWLTVATLNEAVLKKIVPLTLVKMLEQHNVECRPLWKPLHTQPVFAGHQYFGRKEEINLFERGVCLPSGSSLTEADQGRVIEAIRGLLQGE